VRWLAVVVVEFCRNTPIHVLIIWVHYALPELTGIKTTAVISSVVALVIQSTGYLAEEYRAGIESIDKGQYEAAKSLGMTYARLMVRIVLPQAVVRMIPGIINQLVVLFKSTSVVSIIAVPDLMYQANVIVNDTYLAMQTYTLVALTYFSDRVRHLAAGAARREAHSLRRPEPRGPASCLSTLPDYAA
jgi:polar amino acid transport system permease protein